MSIQLVVTYNDDTTKYFPVVDGWRLDPTYRKIVVGRGVPRCEIPLDNVHYYEIQEVRSGTVCSSN